MSESSPLSVNETNEQLFTNMTLLLLQLRNNPNFLITSTQISYVVEIYLQLYTQYKNNQALLLTLQSQLRNNSNSRSQNNSTTTLIYDSSILTFIFYAERFLRKYFFGPLWKWIFEPLFGPIISYIVLPLWIYVVSYIWKAVTGLLWLIVVGVLVPIGSGIIWILWAFWYYFVLSTFKFCNILFWKALLYWFRALSLCIALASLGFIIKHQKRLRIICLSKYYEFKGLKLCVVCFERPRNTAIIPCGHRCLCYQCGKEFISRKFTCSICTRAVERVVQIID